MKKIGILLMMTGCISQIVIDDSDDISSHRVGPFFEHLSQIMEEGEIYNF